MKRICIKTYCNLNEYYILITNVCNLPLIYTRVYGNYFECPLCVCENYINVTFIPIGSSTSLGQITYRVEIGCVNVVYVNAFFPSSSNLVLQTFSLRDENYNLPVSNAILSFTQT